jgi:thiamine monophosphate kinase
MANPVLEALGGGDDYELLITARPRLLRRLHAAVRPAGISLTRIGVCTADPSVVLRRAGDPSSDIPLPQGYRHFS